MPNPPITIEVKLPEPCAHEWQLIEQAIGSWYNWKQFVDETHQCRLCGAWAQRIDGGPLDEVGSQPTYTTDYRIITFQQDKDKV